MGEPTNRTGALGEPGSDEQDGPDSGSSLFSQGEHRRSMSLIEHTQTPKFGPIGHDVYRRTYSRPMEDGTNEGWYDTVRRVFYGNAELDPSLDPVEVSREIELANEFKLMPAGRHLWVTGIPGVPGEGRRNCWRAPVGAVLKDHAEFLGGMLMIGGGVGANYSESYLVNSRPVHPISLTITCSREHADYGLVKAAAGVSFRDDVIGTVIPDTREGWVWAWGHLFDAATISYGAGQILVYDVSNIRKVGDEIKTFGGTASGPAPLVSSLVGMADVLYRAVGRRITGLELMDCDHAMASAVVAGGARRSARMSIKHWRDSDIFEFIHCKADHMHHWTTNISVEVDDEFFAAVDEHEPHAIKVLTEVVAGMYRNGEPGFYNSSLASIGEIGDVRATNPCGEVPLEEGESCNIGSVDMNAIGTDDEEMLEAFGLMAKFLLRQTLTPMTNPISSEVESRNRRIGTGFLGFQGWAAAHGIRYSDSHKSQLLRDKLTMFAEHLHRVVGEYADSLGVPRPIKDTAIAPNGTISQIGGTGPGAHATLARHCIRNVRYTTGDPRIQEAIDRGLTVEPCIYAENTWVVSYPMADPLVEQYDPSLIEQIDEVSVWDQFAVLAMITETFCGVAGNGVSFTASFDPHTTSPSDLYVAVREWLPRVKGMTVFPSMSRPQSPYIPITEAQYLSMTDKGGTDTGDTGDEELACSISGGCPIR